MTSGPNATEANLGLPNDLPLTKWAHRVSRIFHALMLADTRDPPSLPLTLSKPRAPHPLVPLIRSVRKGKNPQSAASPHPTRRRHPASNSTSPQPPPHTTPTAGTPTASNQTPAERPPPSRPCRGTSEPTDVAIHLAGAAGVRSRPSRAIGLLLTLGELAGPLFASPADTW